MIVEANSETVRLVDSTSKNIIKAIEYPDMTPVEAQYSPDGKTLLLWFAPYIIGRTVVYLPTGDGDTAAQLWTILPGEEPSLRATITTGKWCRDLYPGYQLVLFTQDGVWYIGFLPGWEISGGQHI